MGYFTNQVLDTPLSQLLAQNADQWSRGGSTNIKCTDVPLDKTGDSWKKAYDQVSKLLTGSVKTEADGRAGGVRDILNMWSGAEKNDRDLVNNINQYFSGLFDQVKDIVRSYGRKQNEQDAIDNFRSTTFSAMMAVGAYYQTFKAGDDFSTTFNKVKLTTRCDSVYERFGDLPQDWQINRTEGADNYWQTKWPQVAKDLPTQSQQIKEDLGTLADANKEKAPAAFARLAENLDALIKNDNGAAEMFVVEAVREPLGMLRADQPDKGTMSRVPTPDQANNLQELADTREKEWRRRTLDEEK